MICTYQHDDELVLFYPTASLADQVMSLAEARPAFSIQMASPVGDKAVRLAAMGADVVVLDATHYTSHAMHALELVLQHMEPDQVAVYTERTDAGLEVFVRARGVLFLLGPMSTQEWESFLWPLRRSVAGGGAFPLVLHPAARAADPAEDSPSAPNAGA